MCLAGFQFERDLCQPDSLTAGAERPAGVIARRQVEISREFLGEK